MNILDLHGLYVAYNNEEDFRVLICANEIVGATKIAKEYFKDSKMSTKKISTKPLSSFEAVDNLRFDCDCILMKEG